MVTLRQATSWVTSSNLLDGYLIVNIAILGECMDTKQILTDLRVELNRINQAIAALESLDGIGTATLGATATPAKQPGKRVLTPAARKRISEAAKARWAARRKTTEQPASAKPAPKATSVRRTVSAASRKKMAEAQRARWAAQKKAAAKTA
jgi:hypothetical protein